MGLLTIGRPLHSEVGNNLCSSRQTLALFQGQPCGDCWEMRWSMYGPFQALQCHLELKLKLNWTHSDLERQIDQNDISWTAATKTWEQLELQRSILTAGIGEHRQLLSSKWDITCRRQNRRSRRSHPTQNKKKKNKTNGVHMVKTNMHLSTYHILILFTSSKSLHFNKYQSIMNSTPNK